jgi:hypothetical protein
MWQVNKCRFFSRSLMQQTKIECALGLKEYISGKQYPAGTGRVLFRRTLPPTGTAAACRHNPSKFCCVFVPRVICECVSDYGHLPRVLDGLRAGLLPVFKSFAEAGTTRVGVHHPKGGTRSLAGKNHPWSVLWVRLSLLTVPTILSGSITNHIERC